VKINGIIYLLTVLIILTSCNEKETAFEILQKTINTIDTIETIYYKQDMSRSNPQNILDTIFRYREMYFKRLISDSIVGVKGHWYMYVNDKENVMYEDIYDGNRLVRKNNRDGMARVYDLIKYPEFKRKHFWSHNTPYGMQYELKYMLDHKTSYSLERLNDTIIDGRDCYQIEVRLEDKTTMPGFAAELQKNEGSVSKTLYFMDMETYYPIRIKTENYAADHPDQRTFMDQTYHDLKFNPSLDEELRFNTSEESLSGFVITEVQPE